ncbi:MAG: hypothetical protein JXB50_01900, partial [Spirochaetes bacterium]|nr:hypothetical protein [Spirochaetota bacterium]
MIEKMKKLSLIIYHNSREKFLKDLQNLGLVHLESDRSIHNDEILKLKEEIIRLRKNEMLLKTMMKNVKKIEQKEYSMNIDSLIEILEQINNKIENAQAEIDNISKEISLLEPWGSFDPELIANLENIGVTFQYYACTRSKFKKLDLNEFKFSVISEVKGIVYFVIIYDRNEEKAELEINEIKINLNSIDLLYEKKKKLNDDLIKYYEELKNYLKYHDFIKKNIIIFEDKLDYLISNCSMSEELNGKALVITGWIPQKKLKTVEVFLNSQDVVYL